MKKMLAKPMVKRNSLGVGLCTLLLLGLFNAKAQGTCLQSESSAGKLVEGFKKEAVLTILSNGRGNLVDRLSLVGKDVNVEEVLSCTSQPPIDCGIEDDGGSFKLLGDATTTHVMLTNKAFVLLKNDGGELNLKARQRPGKRATIPLRTVSDEVCKKIFPYSNEISDSPSAPTPQEPTAK